MSTEESGRIVLGLLSELAKEEEAVGRANVALAEARAKFDVASRKYAAVRDMVTARLTRSPYCNESIAFYRSVAVNEAKVIIENPGQYRYLYMSMGDAIVDVLQDTEEPLGLGDIVKRLRDGGYEISDVRQVNAALMKTSGITKTEDGKYELEETEEEPEDLPF